MLQRARTGYTTRIGYTTNAGLGTVKGYASAAQFSCIAECAHDCASSQPKAPLVHVVARHWRIRPAHIKQQITIHSPRAIHNAIVTYRRSCSHHIHSLTFSRKNKPHEPCIITSKPSTVTSEHTANIVCTPRSTPIWMRVMMMKLLRSHSHLSLYCRLSNMISSRHCTWWTSPHRCAHV